MRLLRGDGPVLRIGHRGAPALAPENTLRSFERAIELGVDCIELDVLSLADGTLVVAHSDDLAEVTHDATAGLVEQRTLAELRTLAPDLPTLDEALDFIAARAVGVQVDHLLLGQEAEVAAALARHGLVERSLVTSFHGESLRQLHGLAPELALGLTYPFDRRGVARRRLLTPAVIAALLVMRRSLPYTIPARLARAGALVATLHSFVVSPAVIERCHRLGVAVFAWTVNDRALAERLDRAGIDGIITDDPRIFEGTLPT